MRPWQLFIFAIPLAGIAYAMWRTWTLLPLPTSGRIAVIVAILICLGTFFLQFSGSIDRMPMTLATVVYEVGNSSFFILLYVVLLFLVLQLLQLVHVVPYNFLHHSWLGTITVAVLLTTVFTYGYFHYMHKVRVPLASQTEKKLEKPVRIVMLSDLHLGYHNGKAELQRWIGIINRENPDLVLIAGDIIDRHVRPLLVEHMAEDFHSVNAPIVACLGNHEYYSDLGESLRFYRDAGITLLRDSSVTLCGINIIGRDDRTNPARKRLTALMEGVDRSHYTILLDHQPYQLEEAEHEGVDFQLSGHTHHGQIWPASWITDAIFEDAWGPLQKGLTHYYVSSGMGIWGAKFRIGTRSEYVVMTVQ